MFRHSTQACCHAGHRGYERADAPAGHRKVQEWLGHANISTTRLYYRRHMNLEDSPTFKITPFASS